MTLYPRRRHLAAWAVSCIALMQLTSSASAQSYNVEASGYGQLEPGAALVILGASGEFDPRFYAEAYVWGGYDQIDGGEADVMTMIVGFRDPEGRGDARLGRLMIRSGALRPLHIDGIEGSVRLPGELRLQAFVGAPVVPNFSERSYDWVVGTRLSRAIGDWGSTGVSYAYMRLDGQRADQEVGFDFGANLTSWFDLNAKLSADILNPGIAETLASAVFRKDIWTTDLFYSDRDPSRMLPSNSLFAALGAYASRRVGASLIVRAAPRLDVNGTAAMRIIDRNLYESILLHATLRLDDENKSALGLGLRREGAPGGGWSGLRATGRLRLVEGWLATTEIEVVVPDDPEDGRGNVWPWARVGVQWIPEEHWQVDLAAQVSSNAQYSYVVDGLARLTYRIGGP